MTFAVYHNQFDLKDIPLYIHYIHAALQKQKPLSTYIGIEVSVSSYILKKYW